MANKLPNQKDSEQTFETAIERLENIVQTMESDKMPLEELLTRYEEGIKLVKVCQEKLETAEKRIDIITRNAAGKPQTTEFEPSQDSKSESATSGVSLF
ncbi:MAG: xseB [Chthoniobacteraceae bacterium]|nr:xseB [Chthoniobacteraceae bacterium]